MFPIIKISNLSFSYKEKNIFSNINLEIYKGDFIGIFGENGAGKTTLIKLMLNLIKYNSGEIYFFNTQGKKISQKEINIEYISQKAQNIDSLIPITVKEIVKMGNKPKGGIINHLTQKCSYETIENALKHVNMIDYINTPFKFLSGGQKQRVLIAKALISNPDIIIMDEPTAGIDLIGQKHFYELLFHLNKIHNITILLVSHDTKFIADKIKRLWYIGTNDCEECKNKNIHLNNIRDMFPKQDLEFIN